MRHCGRHLATSRSCPLSLLAGRQICSRVMAQPLFEHARRLGLFMHCERLQEVNPEPLVQATLRAGALTP